MEWQDQRIAHVLAHNVRKVMLARDYENVNQMHTAYVRWVANKPYKRLALNWMRNIARPPMGRLDDAPVAHAPQLDRLVQLAEFLEVPVYMLLIDDIEGDPQFAMRMNHLIATYVNGPESVRQAIDALVRVLVTASPDRSPPTLSVVMKNL